MDSNEREADWLKHAAERWERKKAEEKAQREPPPGDPAAPGEMAEAGAAKAESPSPTVEKTPPAAGCARAGEPPPDIADLARSALEPAPDKASSAPWPVMLAAGGAAESPSHDALVPHPSLLDRWRSLGRRLPAPAKWGLAGSGAVALLLVGWLILHAPAASPPAANAAPSPASTATALAPAPAIAAEPSSPAVAPVVAPPTPAETSAPTASADRAPHKRSGHHHHKKAAKPKTAKHSRSTVKR
ncbi:MAG TPA: hypothetical protein VFF06_29680 [Polyangia bacterium]|nr:hypothetical protein [Polyangia bacterium]